MMIQRQKLIVPTKIFETMNETVSIENYDLQEMLSMNNTWQDISFEGSFGKSVVQFCYLLIPSDSQGALETFMLDALSEDSEAKKEAVLQVKQFVAEFRSNFYLTKRRQKVKAELGISLSVFNPERLFDTFMELINSIDWASFQAVGKQFDVLLEI